MFFFIIFNCQLSIINFQLVRSCIARILLQLGVTVEGILRDRENVGMTVGLGILTEPRLAAVHIHIGTLNHKADDIIATVSLANKLTSQLVEQSTQFDVVATLVVLYPVVGSTQLTSVLAVSVVILTATLKLSCGNLGL